jgi:hypothetical protein
MFEHKEGKYAAEFFRGDISQVEIVRTAKCSEKERQSGSILVHEIYLESYSINHVII